MRERDVQGPQSGTDKKETLIRKAAPMLAAIAAVLCWTQAAAQDSAWYGPEYQQCQGTAAAIVQCVDKLTALSQERVDRAFQALLAQQDTPARKDALRDAQQKWDAYRAADCTYYRSGPGTIAAIEAAECMRVLTERRAAELEQDATP